MVQAVGGTAATSAFSGPAKAAGLEYQLQRYQKQLSECVNCASAKTAQGKANIEAISGVISSLRVRIDAVASTNPVRQVASATATPVTATATGLSGTIDIFA